MCVLLGVPSLGSRHRKGITGPVKLGQQDLTANGWTMYPSLVGEQLRIFEPQWVDSVDWSPLVAADEAPASTTTTDHHQLVWYAARFSMLPLPANLLKEKEEEEEEEVAASVLLDLAGLTRGRVFLNGEDLGRYWLQTNDRGDFIQQYYHVPLDWLQPTDNLVVVVDELGGAPHKMRVVVSTMRTGATQAPSQGATQARERVFEPRENATLAQE